MNERDKNKLLREIKENKRNKLAAEVLKRGGKPLFMKAKDFKRLKKI